MKLETLHITKIINGGFGIGQLPSGQVVLVRHVLPDERVIVTIEENKKNYLFGKLYQIVESHPQRCHPPCPYTGECGGCDLQHGEYNLQLSIKKEIIRELLCRSNSAPLCDASLSLLEPIGAPDVFSYRQRIRLQTDSQKRLGFHRFQTHTVIPIAACLLAEKPINSVLNSLRTHPDGHKLTAISSAVEVQKNPLTGKTVVICKLTRKPRRTDIETAERFARGSEEVERVFFSGESFSLMGPYGQEGQEADNRLGVCYPKMRGQDDELCLSWEAGGFCQVNLHQNLTLIETVSNFCQATPQHTVLDLFCGMGNFAIPLAKKTLAVTGIEGQGSAIRSAKFNAATAGIHNVHFHKSPIHQACNDLITSGISFDCVIIDPPRQGAPQLAQQLANLTTRRLVYISCDPATLCRDLADLSNTGFFIKKIQPIDMFPQTHHIETVVLLEKKK